MVLGPKFAPSHCDMVDKDHDRHPLAERVCHQGRGVALPLAGMTGHQRLVRAGGRRLPRETLSCSHQRLARARATLAIARQGGLPVSVRGSEVCARGARHAHAGGGRENMHGVGEEELSAQDCAPGPGPRYSDLCDVKKCQQGGRTTHHLQMTTPSCEKLTRADREPRGEHRMPPT